MVEIFKIENRDGQALLGTEDCGYGFEKGEVVIGNKPLCNFIIAVLRKEADFPDLKLISLGNISSTEVQKIK
jgi:hypothetical protein